MIPEISVVLPVYNEAENLQSLHDNLCGVLNGLGRWYEIIYCDDGSTDGSPAKLRELASGNPAVRVLLLRRNFGQTAAIRAGVDHARGDIVVLMDADLQNDPADIPNLLERLDEGYDIVSGWRRKRQDPFFTKVLPSKIANWLISRISGVKLHDHGCTLKAYRRDVLSGISLYGEMHRFISIYGHWIGARVGEVEVRHHPRQGGKSKYSLSKSMKVFLDIPVLVLLGRFLTRPVHFFGAIGMGFNFAGLICAFFVLYEKLTEVDAKAHRNPLLLLAIFFSLVGIQIIMIGLLAELMTRVYHESQNKKIYVVRERINLPDGSENEKKR
ncbi:MAG: glycosyltransferase [Candidatus Omnitrophota bacterium]|nr:MAG: glycosyltransferase [Candidatus Omnitrophota bacterium]